MSNLIIIAAFMALGIIAQRLFTIPAKAPLLLNQLVINIAIPAVILLRVPSLQLNSSLLALIFGAWGAVLISVLLVLFFAKKMQWSKQITGALLMTAVLGNTSYLGFPMVKLFYQEDAIPYAIIYDQIGTFLALAIYGTLVIAIYSQTAAKPTVTFILSRIFKFAPFPTLLIALFLSPSSLPESVKIVLSNLALLMVPMTMFIVGLQFKLRIADEYRKPLYLGIAIKMVFTPLIMATIMFLFGKNSMIQIVTVFETAMPPMVTAGVLAMSANLAPKLSSAMIGFGLLFALVGLPSFYLLNHLLFL
jgi:hypothetical protein